MLIFEELRKPARELQWLAIGVLVGMLTLLGKLWHTQVVSRQQYQQSLQVQSIRTIPMLPTRGRIVDVNGQLLAENEPRYDVKLYLEDIRPLFLHQYTNDVRPQYIAANPEAPLTRAIRGQLQEEARYRVASNIVFQASSAVGTPLILQSRRFADHYTNKLSLPLPVLENLDQAQLGSFLERAATLPGLDLEAIPVRVYPHAGIATHTIGYIGQAEIRNDDEEFRFSYPVKTAVGRNGLEGGFDPVLRGRPGIKALLVNNIGYRQSESIRAQPEPGWDLHLTLDLDIQKAADRALLMSGPDTRGAAVVMDVRNGDILALASSPTFNLNEFIGGISHDQWAKLSDPKTSPQLNRATQGAYPPGSVFKIIVGLAALELGLDPAESFRSDGKFYIGRRRIDDTAGAGLFDFRRAFAMSSNPYFIHYGLKVGVDPILLLAKQFRLGERTEFLNRHELPSAQERGGHLPRPYTRMKNDGLPWLDGDTANLSIGQGEIAVTPLQVAAMIAAVANGGILYTPRLVSSIQPQDTTTALASGEHIPSAVIRGRVNVSERSMQILHDAMLADVEESYGSGKEAYVAGMGICGKTGTAQLSNPTPAGDRHITWFASFAPFGNPKYAVVVMQEGPGSGGSICAPKAREIYKALQKRDAAPSLVPSKFVARGGDRR